AALTWMTMERLRFRKPSVLGVVTGMVAGLATITPASGFVGPLGALVIGLCAGVLCFLATNAVKRVLKIDDSLDVFPVHGVGGILGTLLTGVFVAASLGGVGLAPTRTLMAQVGIQLLAILTTVIWTLSASFVILKVVDALVGLRVTEAEETEGLDITQHEEKGYSL
ncbi:MAG: ammonia channel protein, partial [Pseudomonadota bacterium]|nr:ammonia channel protein [Pseudomonadota bacterium]